jgi:hypothetical protein
LTYTNYTLLVNIRYAYDNDDCINRLYFSLAQKTDDEIAISDQAKLQLQMLSNLTALEALVAKIGGIS